MFDRKLRRRIEALERDWSPVINAALGEIGAVRRDLQAESRVELQELGRRMYDVERLLETTADKVDELEIKTEGRPVRLTRAKAASDGT